MNTELFEQLSASTHGAIVHFPISLLIVSIVFDLVARRWPQYGTTAWYLLVLGALGAIAATVSGLVAHLPYEETPLAGAIEVHQFSAFATTALFVALAVWRWRMNSQQRANVPGTYLAAAVVGLLVLTVTGYLGGQLVYEFGVGVNGVTR